MKRSIFFHFLLTVLLSFLGTKGFAYDIAVQNAEGITIYYNYINDGKELEVTYRIGTVKHEEEYYIFDYLSYENIKEIIIPEEVTYMNRTRKVTKIGRRAFYNSKALESLTIPNTITSVEYEAFWGCNPDSIYITDLAAWCKIKFQGALKQYHLFLNGEEIVDLKIPQGITSIGDYAFFLGYSLTSVTIPSSVTSIGEYNQEIKGKTNVEIIPVSA